VKHKNPQQKKGELRIIAGKWRGSKIYFDDKASFRPTPNRVRETLFNWLAPHIQGAICLDLFAGSGALSFEALSRGAAQCVALDKDPSVVQQLIANAERLQFSNLTVMQQIFPYSPSLFLDFSPFNVVFIDPPFHQNLAQQVINWLQSIKFLTKPAFIYVEQSIYEPAVVIPPDWQILKEKTAGNVRYLLLS